MAGRRIVIDIIGDATKFTRATKEATGSAQKLGGLFGKGLGLGAGISAFNLASDAISRATDYLSDAVAMAREEEVGIARLGASLKANVANWDGNTDAIEKQIGAMVRSTGFSDGDMRDSLARLVGATKDVNKAFALQATAMDLARYKGISLQDASTALIKIEGGQYRALKELIGSTKDITNETEALAAVQKVAGGQMAAYMDTAAGKTDVLNNRLADLQEEIGIRLSPALMTVTDDLLTMMDVMDADAPLTLTDRLRSLGDVAGDVTGFLFGMAGANDILKEAQRRAADETARAAAATAGAWDTGSERIGMALGYVSDTTDTTKDSVVADVNRMTRSYTNMADILLGQYTDNFDRAMDITEARAALHAAKNDEDRAQAYADLAAAGALSAKGFDEWAATLERLAAKSKGKVRDAYLAALADIRALRAAAKDPVIVTVKLKSNVSGNVGARASGGPASGLTWVGEQGPELVNLPSGSHVYSNAQSRAMSRTGAGGGGPAVVVNVAGNIVGLSGVDELMDIMAQRLRLDGV